MANASTMDAEMDTDLNLKRKMAEDRMTDLSNTVKVPARCKDQKQLSSLTNWKSKMQKEKQSPSPSDHQEQFDKRPKLTGLNPPCDAVGELSHGNESNMSHEMKPQSNGCSINDDRKYEYSGSESVTQENCSDYVSGGNHPVAIGFKGSRAPARPLHFRPSGLRLSRRLGARRYGHERLLGTVPQDKALPCC